VVPNLEVKFGSAFVASFGFSTLEFFLTYSSDSNLISSISEYLSSYSGFA
jgi:hypothetical protein